MLKVSTPDGKLTRLVEASKRQEYLDKGWIIEDTSEVEMMLDADGNTLWRYKEDTEWNTISGGSGTDTYKVKVDGTDTADYLENKLQQGTNVTITKSGGKLVVNSTGGSVGAGVTVYADLATIKAVDTTAYTDVRTVQVASLGLYKFQPASTLVGDDVNVITPTTGSSAGRWIKQSIDTTEVVNTTGQTWSTSENMPTINSKKPLLVNPSLVGKKVVGLGSSVLQGYGLTSPATENYFYLFGQEIGTDYDFVNLGIPLNTTQLSYERLYKDVIAKDPQIVWIGLSPNNNSMAEATTASAIGSAITNFERYLDFIINILDKHNISYIISGIYPKNSTTTFAYPHVKKYNNMLAKRFGARYINWYSMLEDGTGKWASGTYQVDGVHPNATGQARMKALIPKNICNYVSNLKGKKIKKSNVGIKIGGTDITTVRPIGQFTSVAEIRYDVLSFAIDFKGSIAQNEVLLSISSSLTITVDVTVDASGNIILNKNGTTLFLTTAQKIDSTKKNTIGIGYNIYTNIFQVWFNGTLIGTSTAYTGFTPNNISIGGTSFSATQNTKNVTYYNLRKYNCLLTDIDWQEDYKGELIESNLGLYSPLTNIKEGIANYLQNEGIYPGVGISVNSTTFTNEVFDGDNTYTNTEKQKLANAITGTFTTNDGKTITVVGGMITNIA